MYELPLSFPLVVSGGIRYEAWISVSPLMGISRRFLLTCFTALDSGSEIALMFGKKAIAFLRVESCPMHQ